MATQYDRFHFGDVVMNKQVSGADPKKIGMVTHVDVVGEHLLNLTDGNGNRWTYAGPADELEVIGRGLPQAVSSR